jgi:hypothetical protein
LTHAQAANEQWIADAKGCKILNPRPVTHESVSWTGNCVAGFAEGDGRLTWFLKGASRGTYAGALHAGREEGEGEYWYMNGDRYQGEFYADKFDGHGAYTFANGNRYEGDFVAGTSAGRGTLRLTDGQQFRTDLIYGQESKSPEYMAPAAFFVVCFDEKSQFKSLTLVRSTGYPLYDERAASIVKVRAFGKEVLVREPISGCHMAGVIFDHSFFGFGIVVARE